MGSDGASYRQRLPHGWRMTTSGTMAGPARAKGTIARPDLQRLRLVDPEPRLERRVAGAQLARRLAPRRRQPVRRPAKGRSRDWSGTSITSSDPRGTHRDKLHGAGFGARFAERYEVVGLAGEVGIVLADAGPVEAGCTHLQQTSPAFPERMRAPNN